MLLILILRITSISVFRAFTETINASEYFPNTLEMAFIARVNPLQLQRGLANSSQVVYWEKLKKMDGLAASEAKSTLFRDKCVYVSLNVTRKAIGLDFLASILHFYSSFQGETF